jgi:hypothetical protein
MDPYEWPWDNDPGESTELARATTRLRRKVRKLGRKVARMEKDLKRMGRKLEEVAAAAIPRPVVSEDMRRLVGEAQRAAAAFTATRSRRAAAEAARSRDVLLTRIAELEAAARAPAPSHASAAVPSSGPPATPPPPPRAGTTATSGRAPLDPAAAGDEVYRWVRDAVSLLRAAAFAGEGQVVLRERLLEQVMELMAQRRTAPPYPTPREHPAATAGSGRGPGAGPIGRPRLGPRREAPPPRAEPDPRVDVAPVVVRTAAPPPPPLTWPAPPVPAYPPEGSTPRREAPLPPPQELADEPFHSSWGPPAPPPPPAPDPGRDREAPLEPAAWDHNGSAEDPFEAFEAEHEPAPEPEPRRWWSYAPVPPPDPDA